MNKVDRFRVEEIILPGDLNMISWRKMQLGPGKNHPEYQNRRIPCFRSCCWHQLEVTAIEECLASQKYILHHIRQRLGFHFHAWSWNKIWEPNLQNMRKSTYGIGIVITTSWSSSWSCSNSYSILTSHPPCPLSDGQQFTERVEILP